MRGIASPGNGAGVDAECHVAPQVAIGEHDTLGKSGGSRSVVEHGYIVVVHDGVVHIVGEESLL